jgi:hypothetical protein
MPLIQNSKVHIALIFVATVLSAFNGFLSILSVLVFSSHESIRMWALIYLPATLWVIALVCYWFPKSGFATYAVILATSILLCVNPMHRDSVCAAEYQCSDNLRFAILGGVLLLVNLFMPKTSPGRSSQAAPSDF